MNHYFLEDEDGDDRLGEEEVGGQDGDVALML